MSAVVFGVAVTLPREPTCPGRDGISGYVGGRTWMRDPGTLQCARVELGQEAALTFGGREKPSWGQELVTVGQGKSQRARGG